MTEELKPSAQSRTIIDKMRTGDFAEASKAINNIHDIKEIVKICLKLAEEDWNVLQKANLWGVAISGGRKLAFCLKLIKEGYIPGGRYGLRDEDYDDIREIYLKILSHKVSFVNKHWPHQEDNAKKHPFYPEMYHHYPDKRRRVCAIAEKHTMHSATENQEYQPAFGRLLGPSDRRNIALFSLGGFFNWTQATSSTNAGSTCFLVVRAVLHAAGCNMVVNRGTTDVNVPGGLKHFPDYFRKASVDGAELNRFFSPEPGDCFYLSGPPFTTGRHVGSGSGHMGIITKVSAEGVTEEAAGESWYVVEGGQGRGSAFTCSHKKTMNRNKPFFGRPGRTWSYEQDSTGNRTIQEIYDLDKIPPDKWMTLDDRCVVWGY